MDGGTKKWGRDVPGKRNNPCKGSEVCSSWTGLGNLMILLWPRQRVWKGRGKKQEPIAEFLLCARPCSQWLSTEPLLSHNIPLLFPFYRKGDRGPERYVPCPQSHSS